MELKSGTYATAFATVSTQIDGGVTQIDTPKDDATQIDGGSETAIEPEPASTPKPTEPKKKSKWWLWLLLALVLVAVGGGFFIFPNSHVATTGNHNGYEWVDLGLPSGLKWATCNVGASNPEDYGNYYAWGETSPKSSYTEDNCSTWEQNIGDIAGTHRDAARVNWGGSWRMPRRAEIDELAEECDWTWTSINGHNGYRVTGPNGNSIFLPAAGYRYASSYYVGSRGYYWSSTPYESNTRDAYGLYFDSGFHSRNWSNRSGGLSVRPVLE